LMTRMRWGVDSEKELFRGHVTRVGHCDRALPPSKVAPSLSHGHESFHEVGA
jgi:hypothetical protein